MTLDLTTGVSWKDQTVDGDIAILTSPLGGGPTTLVFHPTFEKTLEQALSEIDVSWAAGAEFGDPDIMINVGQQPIYLFFLAAKTDLDGTILEWAPNGIRLYNPLDNFNNFYTMYLQEDGTYRYGVMQPGDIDLRENQVEGFDVILQPALPPVVPEEPTSDERILITNIKADDSNGFALAFDSATTFSSFGSEEAVEVLGPGEATVCLAPMKFVDNALPTATSKCIELDGYFAVEINGVMVPYYFEASDLPRYFNSTNEHGVQFLSCAIECVPAGFDVSPLPTSIDGGWKIDYSIDGGPKQSWSQIDRTMTYYQDLLVAMLYGIFDPEATDVKLTDGGGGTAHFRRNNSSLQGARGGPGDQSHKVTFYRQAIDPGEAYTDLYDYFFSDVVANQFDIISCGLEDFPGY